MLEKLFNIKKRFFKRELAQTNARIWSDEFSRYTVLFEREKTRQLLDSGNDHVNRLKANPNTKKEEIEAVEKKMEALRKEVDDYDIMLNGCEPNEKFPEGVRGINQKLEAQVQKREHIKNFIKHYC